jgi:hypothetical protein
MKFLRFAVLTFVIGAALAVTAVMAQYPPPETPTPTTPPDRTPTAPPPAPPNTGEGIVETDDGGFSTTFALIAVGGVIVAGAGAYAVYGGTRRS